MSEIPPSSSAGSAPRARAGVAAPSATALASATPSASAVAPRSAAQPVTKSAPMVDPRELQKKLDEAVNRLNEQMQDNRRQLGFSVDDRLNRQIVRVTNKETGELVRQIPSEVVIRVANSIENLKGVLFDKEF